MRTPWISALMLCAACANAPSNGASDPVPAATPAPAAQASHAQLEDIFWQCDYVATTRGMDATPAAACMAATRELRRVKFDGSFHRMLEWWREHKPAEHGRIRRERNDPL